MQQQARSLEFPIRHLARNLDLEYSKRFDQTFVDAGVSVEPTAPQAPNQDAFVVHWIGSTRGECLNRFIVLGMGRFEHITPSTSTTLTPIARPCASTAIRRSVSGQRSMTRGRATKRSSAESGSAACASPTIAGPPVTSCRSSEGEYAGLFAILIRALLTKPV